MKSTVSNSSSSIDFAALVHEYGFVKARQILKDKTKLEKQNENEKQNNKLNHLINQERVKLEENAQLTIGEPKIITSIEKILELSDNTANDIRNRNDQLIRNQHENPSNNVAIQSDIQSAIRLSLVSNDNSLIIAQNQLDSLPPQLGDTLYLQLSNLKKISLPGNCMESLFTNQISQLGSIHFRNVIELNVSSNKLKYLPMDIGYMSCLEIFIASDNELTSLPHSFHLLKSLKVINISKNKISDLNHNLISLGSNLTNLDLSSNQFTKIPSCFHKLNQLISLDLSNNKLTHLAILSNLMSLKDLWKESIDPSTGKRIYSNIITKEQLRDISKYSYTKIENDIDLHSFQHSKDIIKYKRRKLWLLMNQIYEWEAIIDDRSGWIYFRNNVSGHTQWEYPHEIDVLGNIGKNIQRLYLNNNYIRHLPPSLIKLKQLQRLYLNDNKLIELPYELDALEQLHVLSLNSNELKLLPNTLCQLTHLIDLQVKSNLLLRLPENLGKLDKLEYLDVSMNHLKTIISSLGFCNSLKTLLIYENPLQEPFDQMILQSTIEMKWYLRNMFYIQQRQHPPLMKYHSIGIKDEVTMIQHEYNDVIMKQIQLACLHQTKTQSLNLQYCNIIELPNLNVKNMKLRKLYLDYNPRLSLETGLEMNQVILRQCQVLSMKSCNLISLVNKFSIFQSLQSVNLSMNAIQEIPHSLCLPSLVSLDLSMNRIYILPSSIQMMKSLKTFNISRNVIESIPLEIAQLQALQAFNISYNRLMDVSYFSNIQYHFIL